MIISDCFRQRGSTTERRNSCIDNCCVNYTMRNNKMLGRQIFLFGSAGSRSLPFGYTVVGIEASSLRVIAKFRRKANKTKPSSFKAQ